MTIHTVKLTSSKQIDIVLDEYGSGQPFLFLHGGAGPQSMTSFAQRLAIDNHAHVYVSTHPGFAGTARPDWLTSIGGLADIYIALIEQLDLKNVTVVGSSIGAGLPPKWQCVAAAASGTLS